MYDCDAMIPPMEANRSRQEVGNDFSSFHQLRFLSEVHMLFNIVTPNLRSKDKIQKIIFKGQNTSNQTYRAGI